MSRIPIRLRVTLAFALVMAVVLAALGFFVYSRFDSELSEQIDQSLRTHGDDIASLVAGGDLRGTPSCSAARRASPRSSPRTAASTRRTPSSGHAPAVHARPGGPSGARSFIVTRPHVRSIRGQARLLARPAHGRGRNVRGRRGRVARRPQRVARQPADAAAASAVPVALLLASLAGYVVSGAALRPVEAMRRRAAAISAAEPEQRLPLPEADDELRRLGETLNEMLGRLEAALERERAFVDDASHELRTPLALHKTELELALRYAKTPRRCGPRSPPRSPRSTG